MKENMRETFQDFLSKIQISTPSQEFKRTNFISTNKKNNKRMIKANRFIETTMNHIKMKNYMEY